MFNSDFTPGHLAGTSDKDLASLGHANQNSDTVVQFKVDQSTGTLTPTGQPIQVPKPVCVLFVKV